MAHAAGVSPVERAGGNTPAAQRLIYKIMNTTNQKPLNKRPLARRTPIFAAAASLLLVVCLAFAAQQTVTEHFGVSLCDETFYGHGSRRANITKQLSRNGKLPGVLLDAQVVQEKIGDGVLGPADFHTFYALTVPAADLPAWRTALAASPVLNGPAAYAAPKAPTAWWLKPAEFGKLELFGAKPLTGLVNGWVGLLPDGRIFIYSFTM